MQCKSKNYISICLTKDNWKAIQKALNNANYCIVKNFNGTKTYTYSKLAQDRKGFNKNKYISNKIKNKLS